MGKNGSFVVRNARSSRIPIPANRVALLDRDSMGNVIVLYRILPDSPENFEKVKKGLQNLKPDKMEEDPIAFGLKAIKVTKVLPETPGVDEEFEKELQAIPHVQSVEILSVTRGL